MKQFDLEKAKLGYPVCNGYGCPAKIISFDSNLFPGYPIVAIMSSGSAVETQGYFTLKGECSLDFPDSHFNLMMTGKEPDHISSDVELTEVITI